MFSVHQISPLISPDGWKASTSCAGQSWCVGQVAAPGPSAMAICRSSDDVSSEEVSEEASSSEEGSYSEEVSSSEDACSSEEVSSSADACSSEEVSSRTACRDPHTVSHPHRHR